MVILKTEPCSKSRLLFLIQLFIFLRNNFLRLVFYVLISSFTSNCRSLTLPSKCLDFAINSILLKKSLPEPSDLCQFRSFPVHPSDLVEHCLLGVPFPSSYGFSSSFSWGLNSNSSSFLFLFSPSWEECMKGKISRACKWNCLYSNI